MEFFPSCDLIVSATASPNFTLTKELIQQTVTEKKQQILIDLAVPRDIEPSVKEIEGMTLYDKMCIRDSLIDCRRRTS